MQHVSGAINRWTRNFTTDAASNRLSSETYTYDTRGNMTGGMNHLNAGALSMTYNSMNRLEKVIIDSNTIAYYQYDGNGQRVRKTLVNISAGITETRKYIGSWEVYSKKVSTTVTLQRETLHVADDTGRMALIDTPTIDTTGTGEVQLLRYQYSNHLGTASLELDDDAAVISYEEYYPYGSTSFQSGRSAAEVSLKRYRYTGKERDEETGLNYHGARYYAPWLARWTAVHPLESKYAGWSSYNYGLNNPIKWNDLSGMGPGAVTAAVRSVPVPLELLQPTGPGGTLPPRTLNIPTRYPYSGSSGRQMDWSPYTPGTNTPSIELLSELSQKWGKNVITDEQFKEYEQKVKSGQIVTEVKDNHVYYHDAYDKWQEAPIPYSRTNLLRKGDPGYYTPPVDSLKIGPRQGGNADGIPYQRITTDPSKLSDRDKSDIAQRITTGRATGMDLIYAAAFKDVKAVVNDRNAWSEARQILDIALRRQGLKMFNSPKGFKEEWSSGGYDYEVRIHGPQANAPTGSNSANHTSFRVARRLQGTVAGGTQGYGCEYANDAGNWYKASDLKSGKASRNAANNTHVILK